MYHQDPEDDAKEYEEDEISESEAKVLDCLEELDESSEAGHAVQCNWQRAPPSVRRRVKARVSPKAKGNGKIVRSHLTLEQRRDKLTSLKVKSKCMRCGALCHWAGDLECKFLTSQGGKNASTAYLSVLADEGLSTPAGVSLQRSRCQTQVCVHRLLQFPPQELQDLFMSLEILSWRDQKLCMGQHRNETYSEVAKKVEFHLQAGQAHARQQDVSCRIMAVLAEEAHAFDLGRIMAILAEEAPLLIWGNRSNFAATAVLNVFAPCRCQKLIKEISSPLTGGRGARLHPPCRLGTPCGTLALERARRRRQPKSSRKHACPSACARSLSMHPGRSWAKASAAWFGWPRSPEK